MDLKAINAKYKLADPAVQAQQVALRTEVQNELAASGANPALWDYAPGTVVANAQAGNGNSSVFAVPVPQTNPIVVRIAATAGSTPTCTYAIQVSNDSVNWSAASYADKDTPGTFVSSTFTLTSTSTVIKMILPGGYQFVRVVFSANTNVTNTVDVMQLP